MQTLRVLFITMMTLWAVACSSAEEAPKAKSTSSGDVLNADGGSGSTTPAANSEQSSSTTPNETAKKEDEGEEDEDGEDGEDGEDEDEDEDEDEGSGSALTFKSSHRDDNDYSIAVKVGSKDWQRKEWPNEGDSVQFSGLCKGTKMTIQVKVIHEDGKEVTAGSQLKVEASGKTAKVAFEKGKEEGDGGDENSPDDLVGELSCSKTKLSIK